MDQSLVHTFSWGNSYGPMVLKFLLKFPPTLVLVHGWLFPVWQQFSARICAEALRKVHCKSCAETPAESFPKDPSVLKILRHSIPQCFTTAVVLVSEIERGEKDPHPQDVSLTKKTARFTKGQFRPY